MALLNYFNYNLFLFSLIICFFTEYQCFYVTCEYTGWSEWSSSCGNGMKRVRRLSKQTERIKEQQGGCSGLTTTCEKEQLETKNTQCESFSFCFPSPPISEKKNSNAYYSYTVLALLNLTAYQRGLYCFYFLFSLCTLMMLLNKK